MAGPGKQGVRSVDVDKAYLISDASFVVDISQQLIEINIYQELYEPFMACDVTFQDATDVYNDVSRAPDRQPGFTGHDMLVISYSTKFEDDEIEHKTHVFVLYEVSERRRSAEKSEVLSLEGISIEGWFEANKRISRSYGTNSRKNTVSNYIESIVDEFIYSREIKDIYNDIESKLKVTVKRDNTFDPTTSRLSYIIPSLTPTNAIDTLIREADNDGEAPLFTFYEDSLGFHFADISKLTTLPIVDTFTYEPSNANEAGPDRSMIDLKKIVDFNIIKQTNTYELKDSGLFASKMINIDILRKNKTEVVYDYSKIGPKFPKLNDGNLRHGHLVSGSSNPDSAMYMRTSRTGHDSYELFESESHLPKKSNTIINKRNSYGEHLENIALSVVLNGHSELNVGNKINIVIPKATNIGEGDKSAVVDKYLSGYYMITRLRHIIKGDVMDTIIDVAKDTESTAPITQPHKG